MMISFNLAEGVVLMPIIENNQHTLVQFGYGDVSITPIGHPEKNFLRGITLAQMDTPTNIGDSFEPNFSHGPKMITFEFGKLESLDLFIQQLKLLRGSQADGESLRGQIVYLTQDEMEAEFVRVMDGDANRCILKANGEFLERKSTEFVFRNEFAQHYFINFFGLA
jgi:hypothetical protein